MKKTAAKNLHAYMAFRAALEGKQHSLTLPFYRDAIAQGCKQFFGVTYDAKGSLVADEQNPVAFEAWRQKRR
jgi:hypothetical protein